MQLIPLGIRVPVIIAVLLVASLASANQSTPTPVEVWCVGDDGLTQRLRESLENTFKDSTDFRQSYGKIPGTLVVTIASNVKWKTIGERTRVFYTVNFSSSNDLKISSKSGSCWDGDLAKCADQIVKAAKTAAPKIAVASLK